MQFISECWLCAGASARPRPLNQEIDERFVFVCWWFSWYCGNSVISLIEVSDILMDDVASRRATQVEREMYSPAPEWITTV